MITIPSPTRVTLALDVIRRIEDGAFKGYHELGIVKHQVTLADTLSIETLGGGNQDIVECADPRVPCGDSNICVKACKAVREKFADDRSKRDLRGEFVRIRIDKKIPVQGGMAGGSANAAAMLRGLNDLWELNLTQEEFRNLGRTLGMDVPFFFTGGTAFDSEATGIIRPVNTKTKFQIILAIPTFGVSTKEAYGGIDYSRIGKNVLCTDKMIKALEDNNRQDVLSSMHNDFELSVFERYPRLREIRDSMLKAGCISSVMSGSGSTIIGIVDDGADVEKISRAIDCEKVLITETL